MTLVANVVPRGVSSVRVGVTAHPASNGPGVAKSSANNMSGCVASAEKAALLPFFLAGVADGANPTALFQADRIHPNEAAQPRMLANVWPTLKKQLK